MKIKIKTLEQLDEIFVSLQNRRGYLCNSYHRLVMRVATNQLRPTECFN